MKWDQERRGKLTTNDCFPNQPTHYDLAIHPMTHKRSNKHSWGRIEDKLRETATVTTKLLAKAPLPFCFNFAAAFTRHTRNTVAVMNCIPRRMKNRRGRLRLATSSGRRPIKIMVKVCEGGVNCMKTGRRGAEE